MQRIENWFFNDTPNTPVVTGNVGGGEVTFSYANKDVVPMVFTEDKPTTAGSYKIRASIEETYNYLSAVCESDFEILGWSIQPSVTLQGWTYGQTPNSPVVTGNSGGGAVTYTYARAGTGVFTETVPTDAGRYTVKASIASSGNYQAGACQADFTINKAPIQPTVSIANWNANEAPRTPVVTGNPGNGAVTYSYAPAGSYSFSPAVPRTAGSYTVKVEVAESTNYTGGTATTIFYINNAVYGSQTISVSPMNGTLNCGTDQPLTVTGNVGSLTFTSSDPSVATVDAQGVVHPQKAGNVAITVMANSTSTTNASQPVTANFTVQYEAPVVTSLVNLATGIRVQIKKPAPVTNLAIFVKTGNGGWKKVCNTSCNAGSTNVSFTVKTHDGVNGHGFKTGKKYTFAARSAESNNSTNYTSPMSDSTLYTYYSKIPNKVHLSRSSSSHLKMVWTKVSNASGYQIEVAKNSAFTNKRTINLGSKAKAASLSNCYKGKTCYIRIRSYYKTGGKKYYSAWKTVKCKK